MLLEARLLSHLGIDSPNRDTNARHSASIRQVDWKKYQKLLSLTLVQTYKLEFGVMNEVADNFYELVESVCSQLYIQALKEIPPDVVEAIREASKQETKEVAKRIFTHYLQSIELGRTKDMIVCQDTGIPIYWVDIGNRLRLDGARLEQAIVRGT